MKVLAIDPGLANTGIVLFSEGAIIHAETVTTTGNADTDPFCATVERIEVISGRVCDMLHELRPDLVAIEAYEDFGGGHLREARRRWTTPMVMGALVPFLAVEDVRWQKASVVMRQYATAIQMWKAKKATRPAGFERITNEHTRSAAAHGLYAIAHERVLRAMQ